MAIFIDKRPKLNILAIIIASIALVIFILCQGGWRSNYVHDISEEVLTKVTVVKKCSDTYSDGTHFHVHYKVGEDSGRVRVSEDTYRRARTGENMWFYLSKTEYNKAADFNMAVLIIFSVASATTFIVSLVFHIIPSIFRRYF